MNKDSIEIMDDGSIRIPVDETHATESLLDMMAAARSLRKHTGESLETIIKRSALVLAEFDNLTLSGFMDLMDEITEDISITENEFLHAGRS